MIFLIVGLLMVSGFSFLIACGWIAGKSDKDIMVAFRWFILVGFTIFGLYAYTMSNISVAIVEWSFPMHQNSLIKTLYLMFIGALLCAVGCFVLRRHHEFCLKVINWCIKGK
jgi:hypothetical protein